MYLENVMLCIANPTVPKRNTDMLKKLTNKSMKNHINPKFPNKQILIKLDIADAYFG